MGNPTDNQWGFSSASNLQIESKTLFRKGWLSDIMVNIGVTGIIDKDDILVTSLTEVGLNWPQFNSQFTRPVKYQIIITM